MAAWRRACSATTRGVEAVRLANARGQVVVLPYMGQIVWSAMFDGVELAMHSMFERAAPGQDRSSRPTAASLYHAGLLRNGVPTAEDNHALHGEMPCAAWTRPASPAATDERGPWIAVTSMRDYAMGFGAHYLATPRVVLRADATRFDVAMEVENLSGRADGPHVPLPRQFRVFGRARRIVQPAPFTPDHVVTRTAIPGHVTPTDDYRALLARARRRPGAHARS